MRTFRNLVAIAIVASAVPAMALQGQETACRNLRYRSNFRLNSIKNYLDEAERGGRHPDDVNRALNNARRVLNEAFQNQAGTDQATLWFLSGKVYALRNDPAGADSAFTRAESHLAGDESCRTEIQRLRRNMWIPLYNEAIAMLQAQNYDSAVALQRRANVIFRTDPAGYMLMGRAFYQQEKFDSAAVYYRFAARAGTDSAGADARADAMLNAARLFGRAGNYGASDSAYRDFIRLKPNDIEGPTGLAASLVAQGRNDAAGALYDSLMNNADALSSFDLFDMGVALFRAAQADTGNAARQRAKFQQTARAFEAGLRKNPLHRDALFNVTNAYLAGEDTARVLDAARRLVAVDSMSVQSLTLLARAYQMNRQNNEVVRVLQRRDSLPMQVQVVRFEPGDSTANLRGAVGNLKTRELPAFTLTLEFLNAQNAVVATQRVDIPALNAMGSPGALYDFNITASGRGIITYRYRL